MSEELRIRVVSKLKNHDNGIVFAKKYFPKNLVAKDIRKVQSYK